MVAGWTRHISETRPPQHGWPTHGYACAWQSDTPTQICEWPPPRRSNGEGGAFFVQKAARTLLPVNLASNETQIMCWWDRWHLSSHLSFSYRVCYISSAFHSSAFHLYFIWISCLRFITHSIHGDEKSGSTVLIRLHLVGLDYHFTTKEWILRKR